MFPLRKPDIVHTVFRAGGFFIEPVDINYRTIIILAATLFLLTGCSCSSGEDTAPVRKEYDGAAGEITDRRILKGDSYLRSGKYEKALEQYELVLEDDPNDIPSLWGSYLACRATGKEEQVRAVLKRLDRLKPGSTIANGIDSPIEAEREKRRRR